MSAWDWLASQRDDRPEKRFKGVPSSRPQPLQKGSPAVKILPNLTGIRTDEQFDEFIFKSRNDTAVVNFGSSWCSHCHKMFPHYLNLTSLFPKLKYAVAQVDFMVEAPRGITYTPTFAVYRKGRKVDQFYGANEQQLRDHLWLHCDER